MIAKPEPLANPDFSELIEYLNEGTQALAETGSELKDFEHYVYEAAVEAIYGTAYWDWLNAVLDEQST